MQILSRFPLFSFFSLSFLDVMTNINVDYSVVKKGYPKRDVEKNYPQSRILLTDPAISIFIKKINLTTHLLLRMIFRVDRTSF